MARTFDMPTLFELTNDASHLASANLAYETWICNEHLLVRCEACLQAEGKHVTARSSTAIHLTEPRGPQLTADWSSGVSRVACGRAERCE